MGSASKEGTATMSMASEVRCRGPFHRRRRREEKLRVDGSTYRNAPPPPLPAEVLSQQTGNYDTHKLPFCELVRSALGVNDLARLHTTAEGRRAQMTVPKSGRDPFSRRWAAFISEPSAVRAELFRCIHCFVRTSVASSLGGHGWKHFNFQRLPSLRVHMPYTRTLGVPHIDADYHHQPTEINFWLPLVAVSGSNSLFAESAPGRGDFAPFEATPGQYVRFYGNACRHFTVENISDVTRVSLDIRVIPEACFVPNWLSPNGLVPFKLGQYYTSTRSSEHAELGIVDLSESTDSSDEMQDVDRMWDTSATGECRSEGVANHGRSVRST